MFKLFWLIGLLLLGNAVSASISMNGNKHVFIRDVDFDSLLEDEDVWDWKESWFLPIVMLRAPSIRSGQVTLFARIQGKGFVKHSVESYALRLVNPTTNAALALSPFITAKTPQVLEFTFDVETALANSVFALQVVHFTKPVPFIPLEGQPPGLNTIDGTKIPEDTGREIFISTARFTGADLSKANQTCRIEARHEKNFVAVLSTAETSALELVLNTGISPTFPSRWYNRYGASLVYDPVSKGAVVPFLSTASSFFNTPIVHRSLSYAAFWTGSSRYGDPLFHLYCENWTSSSATGRVGSSSALNYRWINNDSAACSDLFSVLCLEVKDLGEQPEENLRLLTNGNGLIYSAHT